MFRQLKRYLARFEQKFIFFIIIIAGLFRFYQYSDRWALAHDQAWFAIISRYALDTFQLPFLGPFASGGPYQTGGEWFWIVMLGTFFAKNLVISPWIFITLLSILFVFIVYLIGKEIHGLYFGLIVSLLAAFSTSQILQSTNLTNQSPIGLFSAMLIWAMVKYINNKRGAYLFVIGISVGFATSIHLQGILLIPVIFVFIIICKIFNIKHLGIISLGLIIPWVPVLYADSNNHFQNTVNIISYFGNEQSKIPYEVLGRRWLTFISDYIPFSWARVIGGGILIGIIEIVILSVLIFEGIYKKLFNKIWFVISVSTFVSFFLLRYIRTPLYENYIVFLHPFIILLTGWMIFVVWKKNKAFSLILLIVIILFSIKETLADIATSTNFTSVESQRLKSILYSKYPNDKFTIYDYKSERGNITLPLVLYLYSDDRIDINGEGRKIGYAVKHIKYRSNLDIYKDIYGIDYGPQFFDLNSSSSASLIKAGWSIKSPKNIYDSVQNWFY